MNGGWDSSVALAYAAEELLFAVETLTADPNPAADVFRSAHRRVHELLQHARYLPVEIGNRLRNLDALYAQSENAPPAQAAPHLTVTRGTIAVLASVRDLLQDREGR